MVLHRDDDNVIIQGALRPNLTQALATSGTSNLSSALLTTTKVIRLVSTQNCWFKLIPTFQGSGATFTASYGADAATISTAGTRYRVGDVLTSAATGGTFTVATLSGNVDVITAVTIQAAGSGLTNGTRTFTVNGGTGTACTFTATVTGGIVQAGTIVITNVGSYTVDPSLSANACTVDSGSTNATFNLTKAVAGAIATLTVTTAGSVTAKPTNPVALTGGSLGNSNTATATLTYKVVGMAATGGTLYLPNQGLTFTGVTAGTQPTVTIASVDANGAPLTFTIGNAGATISVFATGIAGASTSGTVAVAGSGAIYLPANTPEWFTIKHGPSIAAIQDTAGGYLQITELI
jgi:hypothetical protein